MKIAVFISLLISSFYVLSIEVETEPEKFDFNRSYLSFLDYPNGIGLLAILLKDPPYNYSLKSRLEEIENEANTIKEQKLKEGENLNIELRALTYSDVKNSSDARKEILLEVERLQREYKNIKEEIAKIQLEDIYLSRMNCKKTEAECYNLDHALTTRDHKIPYFKSLNFILDNLNNYENDPKMVREELISELQIEEKLQAGMVKKFQCNRNDCLNKMRNALEKITDNFYEFGKDQLAYQEIVEENLERIHNKYSLSQAEVVSKDKFGPDFISYPTGNFELVVTKQDYIKQRLEMDLSPIIEYYENFKIEQLIIEREEK